MPTRPDAATLAALLPGEWRVGATNFPIWLGGDRLRPTFRYEVKNADPLVLDDVVSYTAADGTERTIVGVDRYRHGEFVWRGRRRLSLLTSHWSVVGVTDDASIVIIRFSKTLFTPEGVDILVRVGTGSHEFRAIVAAAAEPLGLSTGEFASLTWLELAD
jgi:hypothetical protein